MLVGVVVLATLVTFLARPWASPVDRPRYAHLGVVLQDLFTQLVGNLPSIHSGFDACLGTVFVQLALRVDIVVPLSTRDALATSPVRCMDWCLRRRAGERLSLIGAIRHVYRILVVTATCGNNMPSILDDMR